MNKVLYIQDCFFRLPENFDGTCGNALMLLAQRRLEQEKQQAIINENQNESRINDFWENDNKCTIAYCIDTEERIKNMEEN